MILRIRDSDGNVQDILVIKGRDGKYYTEAEVLCLCVRDTINPVYNALAELVGLYVEIV